ncbi:MAG: ABC transporter permease [Bacillota bacterium]
MAVALVGLAGSGYREHLIGHYQGSLPGPDTNWLLANEALARAILKAKGLDPEQTDLATVIGEKVVLVLDVAAVGSQQETFTVSGLASEFNLGSPTAYYDYANLKSWLASMPSVDFTDMFTELTAGTTSFEVILARAEDNMDVYEILDPANGGVGRGGMVGGFGRDGRTGVTASGFPVMFKSVFSQMLSIVQAVLLFFVFSALVVSCIMTAIVLYASVLERKKEIGIIKALGGGNRDVIRIFQSEAALIGLFAGVLGITVAFVLQPVLNAVINSAVALDVPAIIRIPLMGIPFTDAVFPLATLLILLAISVLVATIAGRMPSRRATRMAVVDALRDE